MRLVLTSGSNFSSSAAAADAATHQMLENLTFTGNDSVTADEEVQVTNASCALTAVVMEDQWHYIRLLPLTEDTVTLDLSVYLHGQGGLPRNYWCSVLLHDYNL